MSKIRNLADELRERLRSEESDSSATRNGVKATTGVTASGSRAKITRQSKKGSDAENTGNLEIMIEAIQKHRLKGEEKLLLRLDASTVFLLKQLKVASGIDMTQFVSFCLHDFIKHHPMLKEYVKNSLNKIDL